MGIFRTVPSLTLTLLLLLVGGRFVSLLVNADRDGFVSWIYDHSEFWVRPFFNAFDLQNEAAPGGGTFEFASFLAFGVYLLAGSAAVWMVNRAVTRNDVYHEPV